MLSVVNYYKIVKSGVKSLLAAVSRLFSPLPALGTNFHFFDLLINLTGLIVLLSLEKVDLTLKCSCSHDLNAVRARCHDHLQFLFSCQS